MEYLSSRLENVIRALNRIHRAWDIAWTFIGAVISVVATILLVLVGRAEYYQACSSKCPTFGNIIAGIIGFLILIAGVNLITWLLVNVVKSEKMF